MWQFSYPRKEWPGHKRPGVDSPYLWRFDHATTQSVQGPDTGDFRLVSKAAHLDPQITDREMDLFDFIDAIEKHSNWSNRSTSPFLSTFESEERARDLADNPKIRSPVRVYKIDTRKLPSDVRLYKMPALISKFKIKVRRRLDFFQHKDVFQHKDFLQPEDLFQHKVLFFGRIPWEAVV